MVSYHKLNNKPTIQHSLYDFTLKSLSLTVITFMSPQIDEAGLLHKTNHVELPYNSRTSHINKYIERFIDTYLYINKCYLRFHHPEFSKYASALLEMLAEKYAVLRAQAYVSTCSCPNTLKNACLAKKSLA